MMRLRRLTTKGLPLAAGLFAALSGTAAAQTDFTALTPTERAVFHNELREALLSVPQLLPDAPAPPINPYADAIADDLALLANREQALYGAHLPGFGPKGAALKIALFIAPDCPDCDRAQDDLRKLSGTHDLRVTLIDMTKQPDLARALDLDATPSYVLPDMMLRGHIPPIVLDRYLAR